MYDASETAFVFGTTFLSLTFFLFSTAQLIRIFRVRHQRVLEIEQKLINLRAYLSSRQLTKQLCSRVEHFFFHYWMNKSLIHNTDRVLNEVSLSLREEVMDYLHGDIVRKIPLFQGQDRIFIGSLLLSFRLEIAGPGDVIIREGTHGRCMYILQRGHVKVHRAQPSSLPCCARLARLFCACTHG
jgi:hypothetical protein